LIDDDFVLSNETFFDVEMPNANGFILDNRAETEYAIWTGEPCMEDCKTDVKVTMRAMVLDVTPDEKDKETAVSTIAVEEPETPAVVAAVFDAELAEAGKKVFKKCKSCHQVGEGAKNKAGPILTGIFDNPAGAVDGFKYSKAIKKAAEGGLVWTADELAAFLKKPKAYMKGTKMSFAGLKKEKDQLSIVEYLKSLED
jgi:cytochrome c